MTSHRTTYPALPEGSDALVLRLRDHAGLLRLMDRAASPRQVSKPTAKLLEAAADSNRAL